MKQQNLPLLSHVNIRRGLDNKKNFHCCLTESSMQLCNNGKQNVTCNLLITSWVASVMLETIWFQHDGVVAHTALCVF